MADQVTNYSCPACTGPLRFAGNSGKLECDYCGSKYDIQEIEQMYAQANQNAEAAMEQANQMAVVEDEWSMTNIQMDASGMKTYSCPSCGAELVCEETLAATCCPYCGNTTIVPGQFTGMLQPDYVIPFKYEKKQALEALKKHYGNRFLLPKAFKDNNHLEEIKGVYVPFWLYDGASSGHAVYEAEKTSSHKEGDEQVTIKEIYHVERSGRLAFEKIPADASTRMADDLMDSIEPYNYADLTSFKKAYLTGYLADKYDVSAEENAERALKRAKESTRDALRKDVKGYNSVNTVRENVHIDQGKVSYAMMPVWMLHTKWDNKDFMFAMNGQTGKMVGDLPVDSGKLTLTTALTAIISFLVCFLALGLGAGVSVVATVIIAGITALILHSSMKSVAKAVSANAYIKENSVVITHRRDQFVRREVTRKKIEQPK